MPTMSSIESAFCRSAPWRMLTRRIVMPWALQGLTPERHVLEIGARERGDGRRAADGTRHADDGHGFRPQDDRRGA